MPDLSCDLGEEDVTEDTGTPMHGNANEDCSRNDELISGSSSAALWPLAALVNRLFLGDAAAQNRYAAQQQRQGCDRRRRINFRR